MKVTMSKWVAGTAVTLAVTVSLPAQSNEAIQGIVMVVHPQQSTQAFKEKVGLPSGQTEEGRYAVVKLVKGAWGDASYALVYAPRHLSIKKNDVVELAPTKADLLAEPGKGVISRVAQGPAVTI